MGAERAASEPDTGYAAASEAASDWLGTSEVRDEDEIESAPPRSPAVRALAAILALLAIGWTAALAWSLWQFRPALNIPNAVGWIATWSSPIVLLGLIWLWLGRTPRREAERFSRAVETMRTQSTALEQVLEVVAGKIEANHARLRGETEKLMSLGDEASDRLGRVTYYLSKESGTLDRKSAQLESAAAAARVDLGVLLHDLPKAEEQARAIAEAMKEAGLAAHGQAGALEAQLAALSARGREADEIVGSAAQRMAAHVARIDSNAASAATTMNEASESMTAAVDAVMARAAEAIDAARSSLEAQAAAMLATIDQSRAALDHAGEDAARSLSHRIGEIGTRIQGLADHLAAQDAASQALLTGLGREIEELDSRISRMGESGGVEMDRLTNAVDALRATASSLHSELGDGQGRAGDLIDRTHDLARILAEVSGQLDDRLPTALSSVESQAERTREGLSGLVPIAEQVQLSAETVAARVGESEAAIVRGGAAFDALLERLSRGTAESEARLEALRALASEAQEKVSLVSAGAGPELIGRANLVAETLAAVAAQLDTDLPAGLSAVEAQAERARQALQPLAPLAEGAEQNAAAAAARAAEAEATLARVGEGAAATESRLEGLRGAAAAAEATVARIAEAAGADLGAQAAQVAEVLAAIAARLGDEIPAGLAAIEARAERAQDALRPLGPIAQGAEQSAAAAAGRAAEAEAILARIGAGAAAGESQLASLRDAADAAEGAVSRIAEAAGPALSERADAVAGTLAAIAARLADELPAGLATLESQAGRTRDALAPLAPLAAEVQASADAAASRIAEAEAGLARQRDALDALLARIAEDSAKGETHLAGLAEMAEAARDNAARIAAETGPELIESLLRVRETANQAAERAREAIAAVIPQSSAALAEASREALAAAVGETVEKQMAELGAASERALATARQASERLTRQLVAIGETSAAIEARIEEDRQTREAQDSDNFSRRVALLIESLNSTSIDVTKILSNDVTDTAWAAYLKGDRGVFTRRAVRLLDNSESREIVRHYEDEPEFREQVNRYIHDFESMLRRILADRDGSPLGVTLLSSDMGKLYVALAQAIDRLRT